MDHAVVVQDQPVPLLREGLEDRAEPLPGPAARPDLDRPGDEEGG